MLSIREDDLSAGDVRDLLRLHLEGMHAHSPPSGVFALDFSGLSAPNVTVWTVWQGDRMAGIGALKDLGHRAGELKSMRTHLREGESIFVLQVPAIRIPDGLIAARTAQGVQMLAKRPIAPQAGAHTIVELGGAVGSFLVLLPWACYSAQIFLPGAEFTRN